jgi:hypothetical protein
MPAGSAREARNLAAHRDRVETRIQRISNGAAQRTDWPNFGRHCLVFSMIRLAIKACTMK